MKVFLIFFAIICLSFLLNACSDPAYKNCSVNQLNTCQEDQDCFWNYDRCENRPTEIAPDLPKTLQELKVKSISVGSGLCAIDENDQLWCLPGKKSSLYHPLALPHPNYKYKQVAMKDEGYPREEIYICGTTIDNRSVCFKEKTPGLIDGPTKEASIKTVPLSYLGTVCTITLNHNVICNSREEMLYNDNFKKLLTELPKYQGQIREIYLYRDLVFTSQRRDYRLALLTTKDILYPIEIFEAEWDRGKRIDFITSVAAHEDVLCMIKNGKLDCLLPAKRRLPDHLKMPSMIKNMDFIDVAVSFYYICAITKSHDLLCRGDQRFSNSIPKSATFPKAKSLAVSDYLMCYIDMKDKVNCVEIKR